MSEALELFPTKAWSYLSEPNVFSQPRQDPFLEMLIPAEEKRHDCKNGYWIS